MAWRGLQLTQAAKLSVEDGQLIVSTEASATPIVLSFEDLAFLVIDTPQLVVTSAVLGRLASFGIVLIQCDEKHLPAGCLLPFGQHWRHGEIHSLQDSLSAPFTKRCWQTIVQAKIFNQAAVLESFEQTDQAKALRAMVSHVQSGDKSNVEARAARFYWSSLFSEFLRSDDDDERNICLNFGYAVVRSLIARQLVACGLQTHKGFHHCSVTNAFNFADDLIEPFRPFVDRKVASLVDQSKGVPLRFDRETRSQITKIAFENCVISDRVTSLSEAVEVTVQSVVRAMRNKEQNQLVLPHLE